MHAQLVNNNPTSHAITLRRRIYGRRVCWEEKIPRMEPRIWVEKQLAVGLVNPQQSSPCIKECYLWLCVSSWAPVSALLYAGMSGVIIKRPGPGAPVSASIIGPGSELCPFPLDYRKH